MQNLAYYNGKISRISEMMIPATDRAVYFGDGVYDATAVANFIPFALDAHIDRFFNSFSAIKLDFKMSKSELRDLLLDLVVQLDDGNSMIYWQCSRGSAPRGHAFPFPAVEPALLVFITPFTMHSFENTKRLLTVEDTRYLHCGVKTINLLPNVLAAQKAAENDCDEVVFHRGEIVTEGCHSNILMIKDGVLCSHPLGNLILPGITRAHLMELAPTVGLKTSEKQFTLAELYDADEVLITSSGSLCNAASELDGKAVGGRAPELLGALQKAYGEKFNRETGSSTF